MLLDKLFNVVFPSSCLVCRKATEGNAAICEECFAGIKINSALFCGKCGARLPTGQAGAPSVVQLGGTKAGRTIVKKTCHEDFPYLLGAATDYADEAVKNLVHVLKFKCVKSAAEPLTQLLVRYAENLRLPLANHLIIPVPLSGRRLRERGFNQSELIAKIFAAHFGLPMETKNFLRIKNSKAQSETKNLGERRENVKGCFAVRNPELLRGKKIILIDDVTTSGATFLEAALALKSTGARKITALAVARA